MHTCSYAPFGATAVTQGNDFAPFGASAGNQGFEVISESLLGGGMGAIFLGKPNYKVCGVSKSKRSVVLSCTCSL